MRVILGVTLGLSMMAAAAVAAGGGGFTIIDAINQAVQTNPGVGEAAANRRATETELRQNQGTLLPQVRLEAKTGREIFDFRNVTPPLGNNHWLNAREASVSARQLLFDGFTSINEIWRQAARVDAAAYRVRERTELIALDAAEAYIDVVRYTHLIAIAVENLAAHERIFSNVQARFEGGRAGEGDLEQIRERVEAAKASLAQFRQQYDEARGAFRKVIGIEPYNLRVPGRLRGLPGTKDQSLATTLRYNPTIQAAQSDREAAKYGFDATAGAFVPTITLEGNALRGFNTGTIFGTRTDVSGFLVARWDVFRGGQDVWKRAEAAERYSEQTMRHARLQRDAFESIDKAWAARTLTADRMAALTREIAADRKVIAAYQKEYELGQRSLIDLLNAQNQLFNALVSLESTRGVAVFADYQLLAAMGQLLEYLKSPQPVDAEPLDTKPFGLIPTKLPPILFTAPEPGSEPLNVGIATTSVYATAGPAKDGQGFADRWPSSGPLGWFEGLFAATSRAPAEAAPPPAAAAAPPPPEPAPLALQPDLPPRASSFAPVGAKLPDWVVWPDKVNRNSTNIPR
jgi:outer membrane protein, adhesin transport system